MVQRPFAVWSAIHLDPHPTPASGDKVESPAVGLARVRWIDIAGYQLDIRVRPRGGFPNPLPIAPPACERSRESGASFHMRTQ
jgi:hypothetical protein